MLIENLKLATNNNDANCLRHYFFFVFKFIEEDGESSLSQIGRLKFDQFDVKSFLANSSQLMGSEGKEYDLDEEQTVSGDNKERLAKQRQLLNARLGLDVASKLGMDVSDIYTNDDLVVAQPDIQESSIKTDDSIIKV